MNRKNLMLCLAVVTIWGASFTAIKLALGGVSPMLLAALRFTLAAIPAIAFVPRPAVALRYIIFYGFTVGVSVSSDVYSMPLQSECQLVLPQS